MWSYASRRDWSFPFLILVFFPLFIPVSVLSCFMHIRFSLYTSSLYIISCGDAYIWYYIIYSLNLYLISGYLSLSAYAWGVFLAYMRRRLSSRLRFSVFWEAGRDSDCRICNFERDLQLRRDEPHLSLAFETWWSLWKLQMWSSFEKTRVSCESHIWNAMIVLETSKCDLHVSSSDWASRFAPRISTIQCSIKRRPLIFQKSKMLTHLQPWASRSKA